MRPGKITQMILHTHNSADPRANAFNLVLFLIPGGSSVRRQLYEYIRFADEKKVKAIFTIVEDEINEKRDVWDKAFSDEMEQRAKEHEEGKVSSKKWETVKVKAATPASRKAV